MEWQRAAKAGPWLACVRVVEIRGQGKALLHLGLC